jgi:hypothetical protein
MALCSAAAATYDIAEYSAVLTLSLESAPRCRDDVADYLDHALMPAWTTIMLFENPVSEAIAKATVSLSDVFASRHMPGNYGAIRMAVTHPDRCVENPQVRHFLGQPLWPKCTQSG